MTFVIIFAVLSYIFGTLPSGIICAAFFKLGDLRQIGSGNIGATNVLRTGNKWAALITLLLDTLKGVAAVSLWHLLDAPIADSLYGVIFGFCAFLGHVFPIWFGFKGGKGVATYLGVLFGINIICGVFGCILWLIGAKISKISSIGALNMAILMPLLLFIGGDNIAVPFIILVASIILIAKHKQNIIRILNKTEPRIGQSPQ